MNFESVYLTRNPFRITPDEESSKHWAGDSDLEKQIIRLAKTISYPGQSTIKSIWGWYGSGKTHSLLYIDHYIQLKSEDSICVYLEFTTNFTDFLSFYRNIMRNIFATYQIDKIIEAFKEIYRKYENEEDFIRRISPDCKDFFYGMYEYIYGHNEESKKTVQRWLIGDKVHLNDLRKFNIFNIIH